MAWRCYGTFNSLLYSAMRFYNGFRRVRCTDTGWFQAMKLKKKKKKFKKRKGGETLRSGERRGKYCHRRSRAPSCNVYFRFVAHELTFSRSLIGTSIALSHAPQQMYLIKRIYFMYKRETALRINACGTIVIKDIVHFFSDLIIDDKKKLESHRNVA